MALIGRVPLKKLSVEELDALEFASFGIIGVTLEGRRDFWEMVNGIENDPKGDRVVLKSGQDKEIWAKLYDA